MTEEVKQETTGATVTAPEAPKMETSDFEQNKVMAIVGYIIPILFFVPMLAEKKSQFGMFHAKQQLNLLLAGIAVNIVGTIIPVLGWFIILPLGSLAIIVLAIIGLIGASKGETKALPVIGGFTIIK
jgi:uncharacterized membrane protein